MQRIIIFALIGLFHFNVSFGQENSILSKDESGNYQYEKVTEVPGKTKVEIFNAIKEWVIKTNKDQTNANFFNDENKSLVSTAINIVVSWGTVDFKLNIDIKDGKYRLSATSFVYHSQSGKVTPLSDLSMFGKNNQTTILSDTENSFRKMILSIEKSTKEKSDW